MSGVDGVDGVADAGRDDGYEDAGQWWLASIGRTLVWARLRVRDAGTAEVFDSDGKVLVYESEDTARAMLMDAEFVAFDGLDAEDAQARGFDIDEVVPPQGDDDDALRPQMMHKLGARKAGH